MPASLDPHVPAASAENPYATTMSRGLDAALADTTPPKAGEASGAAAAPAKSAASATPEPDPEWMAEAPEELRGILGHANLKEEAKTWLKTTYGELHDLKSGVYGTKESLQELGELYPGGIEDLRAMHELAQRIQQQERMLGSGDPEMMNEVLEERLISNPDLFIASIEGSLDALKRSNLTQEFDGISAKLANERLEAASDGAFGTFWDNLLGLRDQYLQVAQSNPEEAQKLGGRLASAALEAAGWWKSAKTKLGYGPESEGDRPAGRPAVVRPGPADEREMNAAVRDIHSFNARLEESHNRAIDPLISSAIAKEVAARNLTLTDNWIARVSSQVRQGILGKIAKDPQFQALMNRSHFKGNREDLRGYDTREPVIRSLVEAARTRAQKLIPGLVQSEIAEIAALNPTAKVGDPAARVRSGAPAARSADAKPLADKMKDRRVPVGELLTDILQ